MASIDRLPSGRWRARWREMANGPQRSRSFARKLDAERFIAGVTADIARGQYLDPAHGRTTFGDYAATWSAAQPWRPSTRNRVDLLLRVHLLPALGDRQLGTIRTSELQAIVGHLAADGYAPATIASIHRLGASILRAAVTDRLIATSPATGVRLPRAERTHHALVPITAEQVHALAGAVHERYAALVLAAAGLGLRQGEACGLTVDRVDFLRRTVRIDRQLVTYDGRTELAPTKTPASNRTVPLAEPTALALAGHLERFGAGEGGLIFTNAARRPISRSRLADFTRAGAAAIGAPGVTFHDLRHFAASALIAAGCSVRAVQSFLGHATASETLDTYAHLWPSDDDALRHAIAAQLGRGAESPLSHGTALS